jgi:MFS family permease
MSQADTTAKKDRPPGSISAVLARPQFTLLVIGQTVSQLGDRLHNMALLGLVASAAQQATTGVEVSKIGVVTLLPTLFAPVVGALVDRWNKRITMVGCDFMRAIIVAIIPWLFFSLGYIWPVYVAAFFVGLFGVFFNAAKMALIPDLVDHNQLLPANAALSTIGRFATVAGVVGGGFMVSSTMWQRLGWEGWEAGFYMDAVSYTISVVTLVFIAILSRAETRRERSHHPIAESAEVVKSQFVHLAADMRETFRLIRSHHGIRFVFLMVIVLGALAGSIYNLLTASTLAVLGAGTSGVGILGGLLAAGMIVGSLAVGTVGSRWDMRWMMVLGCSLMGLFMLAGSVWFSYEIFVPISFVGGAVLAPVMVAMDTLLHEWTPRGARGLVFSTRDLVLGAAFMGFNTIVGFTVAILQSVAETPYAVGLFVFGLVVIAGTIAAGTTQLSFGKKPPA